MKYYEDKYGLHSVPDLPAGCHEMTEDEYTARLEEIRRTAAQRAEEAEGEENNDN